MDTIKNVSESELTFIGKVVRKSMDHFETTWDMTVLGSAMLRVASKGNPGMALYMLPVIDPEPNSVITDTDVIKHFPFGLEGDWDSTWDEFKSKDPDQREVFRR